MLSFNSVCLVEAEDASPIDYETRRDTCSSILSPEHQSRPVGISSRVSNLASGSQELHRNDEGKFATNIGLKSRLFKKYFYESVLYPT